MKTWVGITVAQQDYRRALCGSGATFQPSVDQAWCTAPPKVVDCGALVVECRRDQFAQGRFGRGGEARDHVVENCDGLLAPVELAQPDRLVDER